MTSNLGRYYDKHDPPLPAIIYSPAADAIEPTARCLEHITARQYHFVGIVTRDFGEAQQMLEDGTAKVLVVDQRADIPPDRTPRYEVVAEFPQQACGHLRTRVIRPGGEG